MSLETVMAGYVFMKVLALSGKVIETGCGTGTLAILCARRQGQ